MTVNERAAWMIWAEFRAYMGDGYDAAYAAIASGQKGMGDFCDDNIIYYECMVAIGLIPEELNAADEAQCAIWNETVNLVYRHTPWFKGA